MTSQQQALGIIKNEHRTLGAVIDALKQVAGETAAGRLTPDYKLLWSVVYYIEELSESLHQPKKDEVLFPRICTIRTRCTVQATGFGFASSIAAS